jgi:hypothetical protein
VLPVSTDAKHCEGVDMNEAENLRGELSAIHENSETTIKLANLAAVTQRDRQDLMSEAIDRLYRIYIGDPSTGTPDEWTGPFSKKYSDRPAEVVVRQVGPATFKLREPFKYVDRGRPFILCWLWLRRWRLGLVSGLALAAVPFPCIFAVVVGGLYFLTEWIAERFQKDKAELIVAPPPKPPTAAPAQGAVQASQ